MHNTIIKVKIFKRLIFVLGLNIQIAPLFFYQNARLVKKRLYPSSIFLLLAVYGCKDDDLSHYEQCASPAE